MSMQFSHTRPNGSVGYSTLVQNQRRSRLARADLNSSEMTTFSPFAEPFPKLVFLGNANSGKTTIVKQILNSGMLEYGNKSQHELFNAEVDERQSCANLAMFFLESFQDILKASDLNSPRETKLGLPESLKNKMNSGSVETLDVAELRFLKSIWLKFIDVYYDMKYKSAIYGFQYLEYFMQRLETLQISNLSDWKFTFEDKIKLGIRTTGVISSDLLSAQVTLVDTGGTSAERRKWNKYFTANIRDTPVSIMFVIGLGDFDCNLYGARDVNSLQDALNLLQNLEFLRRDDEHNIKCLAVVLNKVDMLREKIQSRISFSKEMNINGVESAEDAVDWAIEKVNLATSDLKFPVKVFHSVATDVETLKDPIFFCRDSLHQDLFL